MENLEVHCIGYCFIEDGAFVEIYYEKGIVAIVAAEYFYKYKFKICTDTYEQTFGKRRDRW